VREVIHLFVCNFAKSLTIQKVFFTGKKLSNKFVKNMAIENFTTHLPCALSLITTLV